MSKSLILVFATAKERNATLGPHGFSAPDTRGENRPWEWRNRSFFPLETGIGPINAALSLGKAMGANKETIGGVINLGVAGSFSLQSAPLRSPVIVTREIWPEFGLYAEQGLDPKGLGFAQGRCSSGPVWDVLELDPQDAASRMELLLPGNWAKTSSVTVAGVSGIQSRAELLRSRYAPGVENMEGFALAWGCEQENIPFLEARVISNQVGSRDKWDLPGALSVLPRMLERLVAGPEE